MKNAKIPNQTRLLNFGLRVLPRKSLLFFKKGQFISCFNAGDHFSGNCQFWTLKTTPKSTFCVVFRAFSHLRSELPSKTLKTVFFFFFRSAFLVCMKRFLVYEANSHHKYSKRALFRAFSHLRSKFPSRFFSKVRKVSFQLLFKAFFSLYEGLLPSTKQIHIGKASN